MRVAIRAVASLLVPAALLAQIPQPATGTGIIRGRVLLRQLARECGQLELAEALLRALGIDQLQQQLTGITRADRGLSRPIIP